MSGCKKVLFILIGLIFVFAGPAPADEKTKTEKSLELVRISGVEEMINANVTQLKQKISAIAEKMIVITRSQFPDLKPTFMGEAQKVCGAFTTRMNQGIDADAALSIWARAYARNFEEAELDELIRFFNSPLGKKSVMASETATAQFSQSFLQPYQAELNTEMQQTLKRLGELATQHQKKTP